MNIQVRPLQSISDDGVYRLLMYGHLHGLGKLHLEMYDYMEAHREEYSIAARQVCKDLYDHICKQIAEITTMVVEELHERWMAMSDYANSQACNETEQKCHELVNFYVADPEFRHDSVQRLHAFVFDEIVAASKNVRARMAAEK